MHADIQAPLSGPETIWVCELPLTLRPGEFAVFFPWIDAHMPCWVFWSPVELRDYADFRRRMELARKRLVASRINAAPLPAERR